MEVQPESGISSWELAGGSKVEEGKDVQYCRLRFVDEKAESQTMTGLQPRYTEMALAMTGSITMFSTRKCTML